MFDTIAENLQADAPSLFTGQRLHEIGGVGLGFYVAGVVDRDMAIGNVPATGNPYCVPGGVSASQLNDIVAKYLRDEPAQRHKAGAFLVRAAFMSLTVNAGPRRRRRGSQTEPDISSREVRYLDPPGEIHGNTKPPVA
jgi:hypothetical protein